MRRLGILLDIACPIYNDQPKMGFVLKVFYHLLLDSLLFPRFQVFMDPSEVSWALDIRGEIVGAFGFGWVTYRARYDHVA